MNQQQFYCCHDGEKWAVFASADLDDVTAQSLLSILNDQLSEQGISVRVVSSSLSEGSGKADHRRMRRECQAWIEIVRQYQSGIDDAVPSDYPERFQSWAIFEESAAYVRQLQRERNGPPSNKFRLAVRCADSLKNRSRSADWAFDEPPPPNSKWRHGPVTAPIAAIARALPVDYRTLQKWNGRSVWIQRIHSRSYDVYFDSESRFVNAASRLSVATKPHEAT